MMAFTCAGVKFLAEGVSPICFNCRRKSACWSIQRFRVRTAFLGDCVAGAYSKASSPLPYARISNSFSMYSVAFIAVWF